MANLIERLVEAGHRYTAWDFADFKICLIMGGILLGAYFPMFFSRWIIVVWVVFAVTLLILLIRTIRYLRKRKD